MFNRRSLLGVVGLLALAAVTAWASPVQDAKSADRALASRDALEVGVLDQINALRRQHGLAPLRVSARLQAAANAHSAAMARRGFFAHESADGSEFWRRVHRYYPQRPNAYWSVGENLLWSSPETDPAGAVRMWLNSPPHRRILLTPRWREIGLSAVHVSPAPGVYNQLPVTIVTADFGVRH